MFKKKACLAVAVGFLMLGGCAADNQGGGVAAAGVDDALRDRDQRIDTLESQLSAREGRIAALESELERSSDSAPASGGGAGMGELFPPNARPGECYARVLFPEQYRSQEERVLVQEASERYEIIPARYETVTERVLVKEASSRLEVVPARYETVTEQVLVRPASTKIVEVPATYRTVTEQVLDKPAHTVWKKAQRTALAVARCRSPWTPPAS